MESVQQPKPTPPDPGSAQTYYKRPWLDRWTGHYTLTWDGPDGPQELTVHNRLVDLMGNRPSVYSALRIPLSLWSWWGARRAKLLAQPYPFLVWDAIRYLERILTPGAQVLEVGAGNSTLWLLDRGAHVHSLEPNAEWIQALQAAADKRLGSEATERLQLIQATGSDAIDVINDIPEDALDLAIVDPKGQEIARFEALMAAKSKLKSGGWLVLDNSDHPNNLAAVEALGPPHKVVTGYGAMCLVVTQTAFWRIGH